MVRFQVTDLVFEDADTDLGLPTEMIVELDDSGGLPGPQHELDDLVEEKVAEKTGWLVSSCTITQLSE